MDRGAATKARIIDAAENVVIRRGVTHLTLEAAAADAGLSKGGVLYHFPTRDALVTAMVDRIVTDFDTAIARQMGDDTGPGAYTRAYLDVTFFPSASPSNDTPDREDRLGAALLAAAAAEPSLLAPLQHAASRWQAQVDRDGLDPVLTAMVRLACDGLWLCDLFGLAPPSASRRRALASALELLLDAAS